MNFNINTAIAYPLTQNTAQRFTYQRKEYPALVKLEEKLQKIYKAEKVIIVNSGMEAITTLLDLYLDNNDCIIINRNLYAEAQLWLRTINRYKVIMFDFLSDNLKEFENLIKKNNPKLIHFDNPTMRQSKIKAKKFIEIAHKYNVKVSIDNSIISFKYYNPITEDDADFITESYSKYICGHGDTMAGALICKQQPPKKNNVELIDFLEWRGRCINPIQVYNIEKGLETLDLRLDKITKDTQYIYRKLKENNIICYYNGLAGCIIIPHRNPLQIMKSLVDTKEFTALSAYGSTFNIVTPSRREDSYQDYMSYIRLSIGINKDIDKRNKIILQKLKESQQ